MDRKSTERLRKKLRDRHAELRDGMNQSHQEMLSTKHDYGKDEADRANASLAREIDAVQKSRDRALLVTSLPLCKR
jgi:RNA polymerase-binding transcription factor DksA